jgi:hypothetical protein
VVGVDARADRRQFPPPQSDLWISTRGVDKLAEHVFERASDTPVRTGRPTLVAVRLSEFWIRMDDHFGAGYARSVAHDHVLQVLGGRTVDQALAAGIPAKQVWRAVCTEFEVPARKR